MRTLHRHHQDEAAFIAPCVRPRGVSASPLACKPGTSRTVLDELLADDPFAAPSPADEIRRALNLLAEPEPRTDWADQLDRLAIQTGRRYDAAKRDYRCTVETLPVWGSILAAAVALDSAVDALDADLVDAYAALILDGVA